MSWGGSVESNRERSGAVVFFAVDAPSWRVWRVAMWREKSKVGASVLASPNAALQFITQSYTEKSQRTIEGSVYLCDFSV